MSMREADALVLRRNANAARGPALLDESRGPIGARPRHIAPRVRKRHRRPRVAGIGAARAASRRADLRCRIDCVGDPAHRPRRGRLGRARHCPAYLRRDSAGAPRATSRSARVADGAGRRLGRRAVRSARRDDAPWLVELARAVAASISRPSHEVTPKPIAPGELSQRRASRAYALALDVARSSGPRRRLASSPRSQRPTTQRTPRTSFAIRRGSKRRPARFPERCASASWARSATRGDECPTSPLHGGERRGHRLWRRVRRDAGREGTWPAAATFHEASHAPSAPARPRVRLSDGGVDRWARLRSARGAATRRRETASTATSPSTARASKPRWPTRPTAIGSSSPRPASRASSSIASSRGSTTARSTTSGFRLARRSSQTRARRSIWTS